MSKWTVKYQVDGPDKKTRTCSLEGEHVDRRRVWYFDSMFLSKRCFEFIIMLIRKRSKFP